MTLLKKRLSQDISSSPTYAQQQAKKAKMTAASTITIAASRTAAHISNTRAAASTFPTADQFAYAQIMARVRQQQQDQQKFITISSSSTSGSTSPPRRVSDPASSIVTPCMLLSPEDALLHGATSVSRPNLHSLPSLPFESAGASPLEILSRVSSQVAEKTTTKTTRAQLPRAQPRTSSTDSPLTRTRDFKSPAEGATDEGNYIGQRNPSNNLRHGRGIMAYPNGCRYVGCFTNDKRDGYGKCWYPNGLGVYTGDWKDNKKHGRGTMDYANGDAYEGKEHLSVVVCGHVDAGKSTTCGHLIFKQGGISAREMEKLNAYAAEKGKASFGFAYYLDTCKEERERGVTIQCNTKEFYTEKYHYTIVDAPGHKDYIKNMITGSATADVGLLLVPAEKGGFEAAIAKADPKAGVEEGQTRQHARLLYLLGVEQIIVGINKMDACNWDEGRFNEIKDEFVKMLQMIGFKPKKVPFIPYSGFNGDNLVEKSDKAAWYKGWTANITPKKQITGFTVVEALNNFIQPPTRHPELPVRLPISNIYNIKGVGQIICGTVEQGTLRPGDVIGIVPSGLKDKKIFSIEQHKKQLEAALPGDSVGLSIKGIGKDEKVNPGDIIYVQKDGDLKPIKTFTAMVAVQEHPGVLKPGYAPVVFCRTAKVACKMTKILWKMGKKTGGAKVDNPPELSQYENAEIEFEPSAPLFVEPFEKCAALGRIAVMDSNRLKMLGKVTGVVASTL